MSVLRREYECLLVLHHERNVTTAARKLGMQQSGLSKLLMRLEEELGRKLFARGKAGLIPTAFADRLVREVGLVQGHWDERFRELLQQEDRVEGTFRIGCHPVLASTYLAAPWASLQADHPHLNLELTLETSVEVTRAVSDGELHFGLVANPPYHPDLVVRRVHREHVALASHGPIAAGDIVYYNPDMLDIHGVLKKLGAYRLSPVRDYQLMLRFVLQKRSQGAVLPSPLIEGWPELEQRSKPYYWTNVCLIYRADLPRTRAFREITARLGSPVVSS
jgi:DNA-binding transcriptional LysR family regulator